MERAKMDFVDMNGKVPTKGAESKVHPFFCFVFLYIIIHTDIPFDTMDIYVDLLTHKPVLAK